MERKACEIVYYAPVLSPIKKGSLYILIKNKRKKLKTKKQKLNTTVPNEKVKKREKTN